MRVLIEYRNRAEKGFDRRVLGALARRVVALTLRRSGAPADSEVSVSFVDDEEMRELNAKYCGIDRATDVLSFSLWEGEEDSPARLPSECEARKLLGDIVVSVPTAGAQARRARRSARREIAWLLIHGSLHLLGFDHPSGKSQGAIAQSKAMREEEKSCLLRLEKEMVL